MQNQFIEELKKSAKKTQEDDYKERIKKEYPWINANIVEEKAFVGTLKRMFNTRGGEER